MLLTFMSAVRLIALVQFYGDVDDVDVDVDVDVGRRQYLLSRSTLLTFVRIIDAELAQSYLVR